MTKAVASQLGKAKFDKWLLYGYNPVSWFACYY